MTRVFVDGAVGTTGIEIGERLAGRSEFTLVTVDERHRKDANARADALGGADIAILCLPDDAAREAVALIGAGSTRVIDASTAHRVAPGWTYGFPELVGREVVAMARRVSNPGCYATGFVALVAPLVRAGLIAADAALTCNAVSGYSGGGRAMIDEFEGAGGAPTAWRTYALTLAHKHLPEMQAHAALTRAPLFAPAVAAVRSGMIVDIPLFDLDAGTAREALSAFYNESKVVRVRAFNQANLPVEHAQDTDRLDVFVFGDDAGRQCRLVAALDNLGKGASGAAVQNLNLMAGLPEEAGLRL